MPKTDDLFDFQTRTFDALRQGQNVILQAPTGAGKTRAALYPFLYHLAESDPAAFPRHCVYSAPMRVLVNQFGAEYDEVVSRYNLRYGLNLHRAVTVQTGDRPEDRRFEGDLVFTTLDQTLSNLLGVPYALGSGRANLNAGAIVASYLVFDEFHLFPVDDQGRGGLTTTLQWLRLLKETTPFTLMTATFSARMLDELAARLGATAITVRENELKTIETHRGERARRERRFHAVDGLLTDPDRVLDIHAGRRRSIAIRNTVDRAFELYGGLNKRGCRPLPFRDPRLDSLYAAINQARDQAQREQALEKALERLYELIHEQADWEHVTWVVLLHARFSRAHRDLKEEFVRREFGPEEKRSWQISGIILVATQVVEVGLDITSDALHTEIAPAASVLQRAGRNARFPGQVGDVYVYQVPPRNDGRPNYAPYVTTTERGTCELAWTAFQQRDGCVLRFPDEQEVIDFAHTRADERLLKAMDEGAGRIWTDISNAVVLGDVSARRDLIRRMDNRVLIVYEPPDGSTESSPYRFEGFSLWHGSLRGVLEDLLDRAEAEDLGQALWYPVPDPDQPEEDSRQPTRYFWKPVTSEAHLGFSLLFAVHPDLVAYDAERGFRFVEPGEGGGYRSPLLPAGKGRDRERFTYRLESYADHVAAMTRVYRQELQGTLAHVARKLAEHPDPEFRVPAGLLDQAVRLALALHDLGKLQVDWQGWARAYQKRVAGEEPAFLVAHTLSETEEHRRIAREVRPRRPHHAGEGAMAGIRILLTALGAPDNEGLFRATMTAIARHHAPDLDEASPFRLDPGAPSALAEALTAAGDEPWREWAARLRLADEAPNLRRWLLQMPPEHHWSWWLLYFLIVRAVRLTDGESLA
jgi:CRISPR-associated endonuclease/helicase Cas3